MFEIGRCDALGWCCSACIIYIFLSSNSKIIKVILPIWANARGDNYQSEHANTPSKSASRLICMRKTHVRPPQGTHGARCGRSKSVISRYRRGPPLPPLRLRVGPYHYRNYSELFCTRGGLGDFYRLRHQNLGFPGLIWHFWKSVFQKFWKNRFFDFSIFWFFDFSNCWFFFQKFHFFLNFIFSKYFFDHKIIKFSDEIFF